MKRIILLTLCLIFSTSVAFSGQWSKSIPLDGDSKVDFPTDNQAVLDSVDRLMSNYKRGMRLDFASTSSITVSAGEVVVSNAAGSVRLFLNNTSATTVTASDMDVGGSFTASATHYIYAVADLVTSETATFKVSTNSSAPSGETYYAKIGSFYANGSSQVERDKVYGTAYQSVTVDADSKAPIEAIYNYGTSNSSYTFKTGNLKIAYGTRTVAAVSNSTISNLPYTSTSTYACTCAGDEDGLTVETNYGCEKTAASTISISNQWADSRDINWICVGY